MSQQVKICPLRLLAQESDCNNIYLGDSNLACLQSRCAWFTSERHYKTCILTDIAYSLNVLAEDSRLGPGGAEPARS